MREPAFWWQPGGAAAALLAPLAAAYGAVARARLALSGRAVGIPVVCVGNLTVGGAGKTPTALAIGRLLIAAGRRPYFLTRGYGGRLAGPILVESKHRAADVGDEPLLLARVAPTVVSHDRVAGAEAARAAGADVIVMDDGFQNPSLAKNFSLLVVDGRRGVGNGRVLPAGPLRAPLQSQLARAHALLVVGAAAAAEPVVAAAPGLPVFHGRLLADPQALDRIRDHKVFAFAGIADPEKFFATLEDARIDVQLRYAFPDHHPYRGADIFALMARAEREGLVLVTTEKDFVRLSGEPDARPLLDVLRVLPVTLAVDEAEEFQKMILGAVGG
ncbi:MAG TPA: tetraacyldisaccharide 4'-kinase [Xanthobacteraceae bacterium]|nr:tetraacyldisaccharide 4'-kinase [Xanthobacteraceae bacterium]